MNIGLGIAREPDYDGFNKIVNEYYEHIDLACHMDYSCESFLADTGAAFKKVYLVIREFIKALIKKMIGFLKSTGAGAVITRSAAIREKSFTATGDSQVYLNNIKSANASLVKGSDKKLIVISKKKYDFLLKIISSNSIAIHITKSGVSVFGKGVSVALTEIDLDSFLKFNNSLETQLEQIVSLYNEVLEKLNIISKAFSKMNEDNNDIKTTEEELDAITKLFNILGKQMTTYTSLLFKQNARMMTPSFAKK